MKTPFELRLHLLKARIEAEAWLIEQRIFQQKPLYRTKRLQHWPAPRTIAGQ